MPSFSTLSAFEAHVRKQISSVMQLEVANKSKEILKESKESRVYSRPVGEYIRTYEFLNSGDTSFEDLNKSQVLNIFENTKNMASGHPSWVDGTNQNDNIPIWMEFGTNSPLYSHLATGYFSFMVQRMNKEFKKTMIAGLKKRGITAR